MDEKLGLGPENLSPALVRKVVRHGGKDAFKEASEDLKEDVGIEISAKQVQRITERVGKEWVEARDEAVELFKQGKLPRLYTQAPEVGAVMMDGGRVLLRAEDQPQGAHAPEWKEPKYGCCLTLNTKESKTDPQPEPPAKFLDPARLPKLVKEVKSRAAKLNDAAAPKVTTSAPRRKKKRLGRKESALVLRTVVASMCGAEEFGYILATEAYLRNHPDIHTDKMDLIVRELPPSPSGLPVEIYVFTRTTKWSEYEQIQAEIFDHLLSATKFFDLRVFQEPTGSDFSRALVK